MGNPTGAGGTFTPDDSIQLNPDAPHAVQLAGKPADDPVSKLEANDKFKGLPDNQKEVLRSWVKDGANGQWSDNPRVADQGKRLIDAIDVAETMRDGGKAVGDTLAAVISDEPRTLPALSRLALDWYRSPTFDGQATSGEAKATAQQRLVRLIGMLAKRACTTGKSRTVRENTLERFLVGMPLVLVTKIPEGALAQFSASARNITVAVGSPLSVEPSGIGDAETALRLIAHEVNHSVRAGETGQEPGEIFVDEFYAYLTGLLAGGQTISLAQVNETYEILSKPPYNLRSFINSQTCKDWKAGLRFTDDGQTQWLDLGSVPKPSAHVGWNFDNRSK
jgi:hypothetical protein